MVHLIKGIKKPISRVDSSVPLMHHDPRSWIDLFNKERQNPFWDSHRFKNPILDFLKDTHLSDFKCILFLSFNFGQVSCGIVNDCLQTQMYFLLSLGSEWQPKYLCVRMASKHLEWEGVAGGVRRWFILVYTLPAMNDSQLSHLPEFFVLAQWKRKRWWMPSVAEFFTSLVYETW